MSVKTKTKTKTHRRRKSAKHYKKNHKSASNKGLFKLLFKGGCGCGNTNIAGGKSKRKYTKRNRCSKKVRKTKRGHNKGRGGAATLGPVATALVPGTLVSASILMDELKKRRKDRLEQGNAEEPEPIKVESPQIGRAHV